LPASERKIAFATPRSVGNAARRNRARRKLREFYRRNKSLFPDKTHYLIVLRNEPEDWTDLEDRLRRFLSSLPVASHETD
jgi:ribonuclease P protein component